MYCLDASRLTRLAESPLGRLLPLRKHRRPDAIAKIAKAPVFGRELYELIGTSKIVLNGAIDMAGQDRGNMRCFEAMGCGALLVSDDGHYPRGNETGRDDAGLHVRGAGFGTDHRKSGPLAAIGRARHARTEGNFRNLQQVFAMEEFCRSRRPDEAVLEHSAIADHLGFDNAYGWIDSRDEMAAGWGGRARVQDAPATLQPGLSDRETAYS